MKIYHSLILLQVSVSLLQKLPLLSAALDSPPKEEELDANLFRELQEHTPSTSKRKVTEKGLNFYEGLKRLNSNEKHEMIANMKTLYKMIGHIDWEKLRNGYIALSDSDSGRPPHLQMKSEYTRRRLNERELGTKVTKVKVSKVSNGTLLHSKIAKPKGYKSPKSSKSSKSTKGQKIAHPSMPPTLGKNKKKKCKKTKILATYGHSQNSGEGSQSYKLLYNSKGSWKGYERRKTAAKIKKYKAYNPDTSASGKKEAKAFSVKTSTKSSKEFYNSYSKSTKSGKKRAKYMYRYEVKCDEIVDDDETDDEGDDQGDDAGDGSSAPSFAFPSPVSSPSTSTEPSSLPSSLPSSSTSTAPSIFPSSLPSTSNRPTLGIDAPSSVPSISQKPSVSSKPTKIEMSEAPSLQPSDEPSDKPTISATKSVTPSARPSPVLSEAPSTSSAPTLEDIYRYDAGNCPNAGSTGVPCSDPELRKICDRYDEERGSFRKCWELCKPSFCCIHDADPILNFEAPSCSSDENCAQYAYCYIVWFKFHDTFGPATYLNVEQDGNFFDVENEEVEGNRFGDSFFDQLYFHHFDDVTDIIEKGTNEDTGQFDYSLIFDNETFWETGLEGIL